MNGASGVGRKSARGSDTSAPRTRASWLSASAGAHFSARARRRSRRGAECSTRDPSRARPEAEADLAVRARSPFPEPGASKRARGGVRVRGSI